MAPEGLYDRQDTLGLIQDQTVMVVGCGGIGSWLGYFIGLAGVRRLELFDGDTIEAHNLNRLPFTPADIGRYKSEALAALIKRARPDIEVNAYGHFDPLWHSDILATAHRVVVSTDSLRSRQMVYKAMRDVHMTGPNKYVELGADGHGLTVTGQPADWSTEAENEPGYQHVPVSVAPCTLAASIGAYYVLLGQPLLDTFRIDWDGSTGLKINTYVNA